MAKRPDIDSTEAIKEALEATKKFGPTSPEARLAWDIVEEIDASDNTAAYESSSSTGAKGGQLTEADLALNAEYDAKVDDLKRLLAEQASKVGNLKKLAEEIRAVKLAKPSKVVNQVESDQMRDAIKAAREATEKFGAQSPQAALAWETVEEIASNDLTAATLGVMTEDECLVETIEACEAIEELQRVLNKVED